MYQKALVFSFKTLALYVVLKGDSKNVLFLFPIFAQCQALSNEYTL